jgi:hypothetical protein
MKNFEYTENDYQELEAALMRSNAVSYGRPDQYQYYQNELSKHIASFLLRPYRMKKMEEKKNQDNDEKT